MFKDEIFNKLRDNAIIAYADSNPTQDLKFTINFDESFANAKITLGNTYKLKDFTILATGLEYRSLYTNADPGLGETIISNNVVFFC